MFDPVDAAPSYSHPEDDPRHWHARFFYYNAADRRWLVPVRYSQLSLNFARPAAWVITAVVVAVVVAGAVLPGMRSR